MTALFYRLSATTDPEERLEDACMWKAMHDVYGAGITLIPEQALAPKDGLIFGRTKRFEDTSAFTGPKRFDYGRDPGFLSGISREFRICDLAQAEAIIKKLHASGRGAFLKAVDQKLMAEPVPLGASLYDAIGDMVYSFIDRPDCLMVQEFVPMRNERRFVVIDRKIVTSSPVATHLTPLDRDRLYASTGRPVEELHFETPASLAPHLDPGLASKMEHAVLAAAERSGMRHMIIDVAELESGRIEIIEFNPCQPGMFGLFACDPYRIAIASQAFLDPGLAAEVARRRAENDPAPVPESGRTKTEILRGGIVQDEPSWADGP